MLTPPPPPPANKDTPVPTPTYSWTLLRAGRFKLDGSGMFGVIPKVVWSRTVPCDDRNRIDVQHNCVLLTPVSPEDSPQRRRERIETTSAQTGSPGRSSADSASPLLHPPRLGGDSPVLGPILLEVGTGNKLDPKMREIFALEDRWIADALAEVSTPCESIRHVIVSHLHFDHAGGLTRLLRPGEVGAPAPAPPYPGRGPGHPPHPVALTFPSAEVIVQRREWRDALANNSVMTRTYFPDHLEPIEPRLRLIDTLPPYADGRAPGREQDPVCPLEDRMTEVLPGIFVFRVPGHTWGQQATLFRDKKGRTVVFTPDIMPTAAHVGQTYSLSYDVEPYVSMVCRRWFLREACQRDWLLVLDHERGNPLVRVRENGKGWYQLVPEA